MILRDVARFEAGDQSLESSEADFDYTFLEADLESMISLFIINNSRLASGLGISDLATAKTQLRRTFPQFYWYIRSPFFNYVNEIYDIFVLFKAKFDTPAPFTP